MSKRLVQEMEEGIPADPISTITSVTCIMLTRNIQKVVVGPFTEIKTGYRGFEMNEIWYFVCLLLALTISCGAYMKQNLQLEMAFATY